MKYENTKSLTELIDIKKINEAIKSLPDELKNEVSDGYHTFGELYECRFVLYIALINMSQRITTGSPFIKSKVHFDGTSRDGWFIAQGHIHGKQISYHLPMKYWDKVLCKEVEKADERDGHTSQDVLDRLLTYY